MDELTDSQIDELQADLAALVADLTAQIEGSAGSAAIVDLDRPIGRLSRMDQLQQQSMAKESIRRARIQLTQAQAAIEAIAADEYGYCVRCDEPIGYPRLKVRPESKVCIDCQSSLEN